VTGPWADPRVERISAATGAGASSGAPAAAQESQP